MQRLPAKIEITEQTPPQLKRSTYTPAALASKGSSIAELAKATAVYGYQAKQYFG